MEIGSTYTVSTLVTTADTAQTLGSGDAPVLATPRMIALMENAAMTLAAGFLEAGQTTVGTRIEVSHTAATPIGLRVDASARLVDVQGRTLTFEVSASDPFGSIGSGTQQRAIVDRDRFTEKANRKRI